MSSTDIESNTKNFCRSSLCEHIKYCIGTVVVLILVLVILVGVANGYSVLKVHPALNFALLLGALILLAYVEALHYGVVSIEKWDMEKYKDQFPRAVRCHALADTPEKVKQFLVGRQFFVIFVVFLIAQITSFPDIPPDFAGLPPVMVLVLMQTGLPGVALTLTFGQLISQIFVEEYTIQFMNLPGCGFCIRLSLAAEALGICHFSWMLYFLSSRIFCRSVIAAQRTIDSQDEITCRSVMAVQRTIDSQDGILECAERGHSSSETPISPTAVNRGPDFDTGIDNEWKIPSTFQCLKFLWSSFATLAAMVIVCYGIAMKTYVLPVEPVGAFVVAGLDMIFLFYLEGLMIAIVATQYWDPETWKDVYPRAYKIHKLVNQPDNVKRFIIGRQFCTVLTGFLLAQIFTFNNFDSAGYNPIAFFIIVKSGLVGVLIVLAWGQLMPELLAAEFPLRFMDMTGAYSVVYLSLFFDMLGVGHCAWTIHYMINYFFRGGNPSDQSSGDEKGNANAAAENKPKVICVNSAEILAVQLSSSSKNKQAAPGRGSGAVR